jgi:hypothetical protein
MAYPDLTNDQREATTDAPSRSHAERMAAGLAVLVAAAVAAELADGRGRELSEPAGYRTRAGSRMSAQRAVAVFWVSMVRQSSVHLSPLLARLAAASAWLSLPRPLTPPESAQAVRAVRAHLSVLTCPVRAA